MISGASGRYATALFDLARDAGALDSAENDLNALTGAIEASGDLRRLISGAAASRDEQARAITAIAQKAGCGELIAKFAGLMAAKGRLAMLPAAADGYRALLAEHRGSVEADVVSARPLSASQSAALANTLKTALGREVAVKASVDPSLLGGLIVKVGSKMIDASLKAKLSKLQIALKDA